MQHATLTNLVIFECHKSNKDGISMTNTKNVDAMIQEFGHYMTISDVAAALKVGRKKIDSLVKQGQLPGSKVLGDFRIKTTDLVSWWDRNVIDDQKKIFRNRPA